MKATILGAGVIGQGWAARFANFGWDVAVYDQNPAAGAECDKLIEHVRPHVEALYEQLPTAGEITQHDSLESALRDTDWVQESLPENLAVKKTAYDAMAPHLDDALLASSTSGFKPSALAANEASWAAQFLVCHPFNPVYLLPLVEVVPHPAVAEATQSKCVAVLESIGMRPLRVRKEIDAHIADRLLEAVWREALWLVKDGVATTADIDEAITYGFGLRWAQMGLFETYRLGGGDQGMAQFLRQFGPALEWPWSRLTDVPELDEGLIEKIVSQSDAQSGHYSPGELASIRDENLVAILLALKERNWGAGALLKR